MSVTYLSLTQAERDDAIAQALHGREVEHFHYELNRLNYESMLGKMVDLPDEWPAEVAAGSNNSIIHNRAVHRSSNW